MVEMALVVVIQMIRQVPAHSISRVLQFKSCMKRRKQLSIISAVECQSKSLLWRLSAGARTVHGLAYIPYDIYVPCGTSSKV
jgi:hypothetical protein